jgi:hypothetical protein
MPKPRNNFLEQIKRAREAKVEPEPTPDPEPEWTPTTPELRVQVLEDRLAERDAEVERVRARAEAAERRAASPDEERRRPTLFRRTRRYWK